MPNYKEITETYAAAVGRYQAATKNLRAFQIQFREAIERELGAPAMSVVLFPVQGDPKKDSSGDPKMAKFDGTNSWHVKLAIRHDNTLGNTLVVTYNIFIDMRNGEYFARIGRDGEPYEANKDKDITALANKLAELAIERINERSIDASEPCYIEIK
jgi:hypothetical protein